MRTTKSRGAPLFIYLFILKTKTGTETKWMNERRIRNTTPLNLLCLFFSTEPRTKSHSSPSSSFHSFVCFFFLIIIIIIILSSPKPGRDALSNHRTMQLVSHQGIVENKNKWRREPSFFSLLFFLSFQGCLLLLAHRWSFFWLHFYGEKVKIRLGDGFSRI